MVALPLAQAHYASLPLESPFAWKSESYILTKQIPLFPVGSNLTISFTATRFSKVLGYIPLVGTIIGIFRIYQGIQEYKHFNHAHFHVLSNRSIKWIARGALETIPVLGGIVCMIIDAIATILNRSSPNLINFADETPCGNCHSCGLCTC